MFQAATTMAARQALKRGRSGGGRRGMRQALTQAPLAGMGQGALSATTKYGMLDQVTNDRRNQTFGRTY